MQLMKRGGVGGREGVEGIVSQCWDGWRGLSVAKSGVLAGIDGERGYDYSIM